MKQQKKMKNTFPTKTYPFNKSLFVHKYERPTAAIRVVNFILGIHNAFKDLIHPTTNVYNHYPLVHIWGNAANSNLYTNDDIAIIYNMKDKMYHLKVNTAICADTIGYCNYLEYTLQCFTAFMEAFHFDTNYPKKLFGVDPKIELKAPSIEELYTEYNLFVNAFFALYAFDEEESLEAIEDEEEDDDDEEEGYEDLDFI